jgi:hypothetical protein
MELLAQEPDALMLTVGLRRQRSVLLLSPLAFEKMLSPQYFLDLRQVLHQMISFFGVFFVDVFSLAVVLLLQVLLA